MTSPYPEALVRATSLEQKMFLGFLLLRNSCGGALCQEPGAQINKYIFFDLTVDGMEKKVEVSLRPVSEMDKDSESARSEQ